MEDLKLVFPKKEYEREAEAFIQEFHDCKSNINGTGELDAFIGDYDEWIKKVNTYHKGESLCESHVPSTTYFAIDKGIIVGMIDIRHNLNDYLKQFGGHIGYGVRPSERNKGYANAMLHLALEKCKKLSLTNVLITCDKDNTTSQTVIINNGGILQDELLSKDSVFIQRYLITL